MDGDEYLLDVPDVGLAMYLILGLLTTWNFNFQNVKTYISRILSYPPPRHGTVGGIGDTAVTMTME